MICQVGWPAIWSALRTPAAPNWPGWCTEAAAPLFCDAAAVVREATPRTESAAAAASAARKRLRAEPWSRDPALAAAALPPVLGVGVIMALRLLRPCLGPVPDASQARHRRRPVPSVIEPARNR